MNPVQVMANRLSVEHNIPLDIGTAMVAFALSICTTNVEQRNVAILGAAMNSVFLLLSGRLGVSEGTMQSWLNATAKVMNAVGQRLLLDYAMTEAGVDAARQGREWLKQFEGDRGQERQPDVGGTAQDGGSSAH